MANVPSILKKIQLEEVDFRSPISESTFNKMGGSVNYIIDYFTMIPGLVFSYGGLESDLDLDAYLPCDGRAVSRTYYAGLFAICAERFGIGDGVTTFNVPDLRGRFIRYCDTTSIGSAGLDPDELVRTPTGTGTAQEPGSIQADLFKNHSHNIPSDLNASGTGWMVSPNANDFTKFSGTAGGSETRPVNMYMFPVIKT